MLFDPKWNDRKPDIWSLDTLINWLSLQNPNKTYTYYSRSNCLLARYFKAQGKWFVRVTCGDVKYGLFPRQQMFLPAGFNDAAYPRMADRKSTFGEALSRAKAFKARYTNAGPKQPVPGLT